MFKIELNLVCDWQQCPSSLTHNYNGCATVGEIGFKVTSISEFSASFCWGKIPELIWLAWIELVTIVHIKRTPHTTILYPIPCGPPWHVAIVSRVLSGSGGITFVISRLHQTISAAFNPFMPSFIDYLCLYAVCAVITVLDPT